MKRYTYPAVLYKEEDLFVLVLNDLRIVASGDTVESTFEEATIQLETYLNFAISFDEEIEKASTFKATLSENQNNIILLITAQNKSQGE